MGQLSDTVKASMRTRPIFIVGASRSGTTLMRKTLNSSDYIAICDENHFLGHLIASEGVRYKFRQLGDLSKDENVRKLVDYIYSDGLEQSSKYRGVSFQWVWITRRVDREELLRRILVSDRSERALFTIMMEVFADRRNKPIMGEKTPAHLRYVPVLLEWFPEGKIIHMIRDPRGNVVSELRRRRELARTTPYKQLKRIDFLLTLYIVLQTSIVWFESAYRYFKYKKRYPNNYYLMRFEDLVSDPETHIKRLCDFLEVDFQSKMLDQVVVSRGFQAGQAGFDARAANRWKEHIDPWINSWFLFWFRNYLNKIGYTN